MATKISGIKGINISKSSVLKDGSKKTNTNDSFRDTSNGTTRDNSNNSAGIDSATIKMLLGHADVMAKKAAQIEQQMKISAAKEIDRQKREEEYWRKVTENQEKKNEKNLDEVYSRIDNGIFNSALAGLLGPAGIMLGKGLNKAGIPLEKYTKKGLRAGGRLIGQGLSALGRWGKKSDNGENALDVNKREEAAKPVNDLRSTVSEGFKKVLDKMGGGKGGGEKPDDENWLSKLLKYALPLLAGILSGYQPLKDFGIKYLLKRLGKPIDWVIKQLGKLGSKAWKVLKGPLSKLGSKMWKTLKGPLVKLGSKIWGALKVPLAKAGNSIVKVFSKIGSKIMKSGFVQALKTAGKTLTKNAGKVISKIAAPISKVGSKIIGTIGAKTAAKAATKAAGKAATKTAAKGAGKSLLKKIPIVGALAGLVFAGGRALKGDWTGAGLELASGLASTIPGIGTAASIGIDAAILARDIKKDLDAEKSKNNEVSKTGTEGNYDTIAPDYSANQMQQEQNNIQNEILNSLRQIEYNLNPTVQKKLDVDYLNTAKSMFNEAPTYNDNFQDLYNNFENLKVLNR